MRRLLAKSDRHSGWSDPCSLALAAAVVVLSCWDCLFTVRMLRAGSIVEANPIWMWVIRSQGLQVFVLTKMLLVSVCSSVLLLGARRVARVVLLFLLGFYANIVVVQAAQLAYN